jgi:hypothetical protein
MVGRVVGRGAQKQRAPWLGALLSYMAEEV